MADAQLERSQAAPREAAEKGGSKPTIKTKSSGKSKTLLGCPSIADLDLEAVEMARRQALRFVFQRHRQPIVGAALGDDTHFFVKLARFEIQRKLPGQRFHPRPWRSPITPFPSESMRSSVSGAWT